MPKKDKQLPEPSKEFWDAIIYSSSSHDILCELCDRMHFSTEEPQNYEEGELEELQERARKNPDKYIEHAYSVHWGYIDGKQAVYKCPCNKASVYEKLFWNHRHMIASYFKARTEKELEHAKKESKLAETIKASVETSK